MSQDKTKEGILSILKWAAYHENYDLFYAAGNQLEVEEGFDLFTDMLSRILLIMIYLNDEIFEDALEAIQKLEESVQDITNNIVSPNDWFEIKRSLLIQACLDELVSIAGPSDNDIESNGQDTEANPRLLITSADDITDPPTSTIKGFKQCVQKLFKKNEKIYHILSTPKSSKLVSSDAYLNDLKLLTEDIFVTKGKKISIIKDEAFELLDSNPVPDFIEVVFKFLRMIRTSICPSEPSLTFNLPTSTNTHHINPPEEIIENNDWSEKQALENGPYSNNIDKPLTTSAPPKEIITINTRAFLSPSTKQPLKNSSSKNIITENPKTPQQQMSNPPEVRNPTNSNGPNKEISTAPQSSKAISTKDFLVPSKNSLSSVKPQQLSASKNSLSSVKPQQLSASKNSLSSVKPKQLSPAPVSSKKIPTPATDAITSKQSGTKRSRELEPVPQSSPTKSVKTSSSSKTNEQLFVPTQPQFPQPNRPKKAQKKSFTGPRPRGEKLSKFDEDDEEAEVDEDIESVDSFKDAKKTVAEVRKINNAADKSSVSVSSLNYKTHQNRTKWSIDEEEALIAGIKKYRSGNWMMILEDPHIGPILLNRTNVQLKDKYRNLVRAGIISEN